MDALKNLAVLLGRILIALIFIRGGINKLGAIDPTAAQMGEARRSALSEPSGVLARS